ncbi:class I SAM-dependent methyltransferase [Algoriphagus namhaensis]
MPEQLDQCPLCNSKQISHYKEIIDHAVSREKFQIHKCTACGLLFTNPRPTASEITPYYDFDTYYSHSDSQRDLISIIYQRVKSYAIKRKLETLNQLNPNGALLDYGCGTAELLAKAHQSGRKVMGVEPNPKALMQAIKKLPARVFSDLSNLPDGQTFDIITLYHVLEHIHELKQTLSTLIEKLNDRGYIIIAVPNPVSPDAMKYQDYWAGWDVPRHLYHFPFSSIKHLCEIFPLDLKEIQPMKFDSYYVSLLSEQYQNTTQSKVITSTKALLAGMKSNLVASSSDYPNFSSNLFIFQKK